MNTRTAMFRSLVCLTTAGIIAGALVGCTTSSDEDGSRVKLYNSVSEVSSDSSLVASGTVDSQKQVAATATTSPYIASTFTVAATYTPAGLGANVSSGAAPIKAGDKIVVRQIGTLNAISDTPKLAPGSGYLLFLTPTGLPGAPVNNYYVTGATAGIYESGTGAVSSLTDGSASFTKLGDDGDKLPATLSPTELR